MAVQDTGYFGELRVLLERGWNSFGVPRLRERVAEGIRAREAQASFHSTRATNRWTAFVAVIASFLAVPPMARDVLRPLWDWQGFWLPEDSRAADLMLLVMATTIVSVIFGLGYGWARRSR